MYGSLARAGFAATGATVLAVLSVTSASATSHGDGGPQRASGGMQKTEISECYDYGLGDGLCTTQSVASNTVETPSGIYVQRSRESQDYDFYLGGEYFGSAEADYDVVYVSGVDSEGNAQVVRSRYTLSETDAKGNTCDRGSQATFANGEVRNESYDFDCP